MKFKIIGTTGEAFAKRMLKLAWDASGMAGMGFLQDRGPLDEDGVWVAMSGAVDYDGSDYKKTKSGQINADYVCGRMMKFNASYGSDFVESHDRPYRHDYESFAGRYPDFRALASATATSLGVNVELQ